MNILSGRPVRFSADALPCADCGQGVSSPKLSTIHTLEAMSRWQLVGPPPGAPYLKDEPTDYVMAFCPTCTTRHDLAEKITDVHANWARSMGDRFYPLNLVSVTLLALDALEIKPAFRDRLMSNETHFLLVVDKLAVLGAMARYSSRFIPTTQIDADPARLSVDRFGYLTDEDRQRLRNAFARCLYVMNDQERPVPSPDGKGCLLCGVGAVAGLASQSKHLWGDLWQANPATLGGRGRPDPIEGYLCPSCSTVANRFHALGPTIMETAFIEFLNIDRGGIALGDDVRIEGLRAWCTLPDGTAPNKTPWAHEPDHAAMAKALSHV